MALPDVFCGHRRCIEEGMCSNKLSRRHSSYRKLMTCLRSLSTLSVLRVGHGTDTISYGNVQVKKRPRLGTTDCSRSEGNGGLPCSLLFECFPLPECVPSGEEPGWAFCLPGSASATPALEAELCEGGAREGAGQGPIQQELGEWQGLLREREMGRREGGRLEKEQEQLGPLSWYPLAALQEKEEDSDQDDNNHCGDGDGGRYEREDGTPATGTDDIGGPEDDPAVATHIQGKLLADTGIRIQTHSRDDVAGMRVDGGLFAEDLNLPPHTHTKGGCGPLRKDAAIRSSADGMSASKSWPNVNKRPRLGTTDCSRSEGMGVCPAHCFLSASRCRNVCHPARSRGGRSAYQVVPPQPLLWRQSCVRGGREREQVSDGQSHVLRWRHDRGRRHVRSEGHTESQ